MNYLKYTVSVSGTEIVNGYTLIICQLLNSFYMTECQIYDMDLIAHAGSVPCIIVISEYTKAF